MMAAESRRHEGHRPYSAGDGMRRRECKMVATSVCASFYHDGHAALEGVGASLEHIAKACRLWGCTKYTCWPREKHTIKTTTVQQQRQHGPATAGGAFLRLLPLSLSCPLSVVVCYESFR